MTPEERIKELERTVTLQREYVAAAEARAEASAKNAAVYLAQLLKAGLEVSAK